MSEDAEGPVRKDDEAAPEVQIPKNKLQTNLNNQISSRLSPPDLNLWNLRFV